MYSDKLNFAPDENHLRFSREREEYVNRLKAYQVPPESPPPAERLPQPQNSAEKRPQSAESKPKSLPINTADIVIVGVIILLLLDGDSTQDTVLLGILIYLLLG